jgi:hypothetical protein
MLTIYSTKKTATGLAMMMKAKRHRCARKSWTLDFESIIDGEAITNVKE